MNGQQTVITVQDGSFSAYLAKPQASNDTAFLILQEIFGVNENMRKTADAFAAEGFTAVVPDLFWRQSPNLQLDPESAEDREQAKKLMGGLDVPLALEDAIAALQTIRNDAGPVAAIGYCLGGKLSYLLAAAGKVDAAVSYYGVGIQADLDLAGKISCPTLLHIAAEDLLCPPEAQEQIARAMEPYSDHILLMTHQGVGHAFARKESSAYVADAAENADAATLSFLAAIRS